MSYSLWFYLCFATVFRPTATGRDVKLLHNLQSNALRFVYHFHRYDHVSIFGELQIFCRWKQFCGAQTCFSVHRVITLEESLYLVDSPQSRGEVAQRSTRQYGELHFPHESGRRSLQVGRKGFSYFGPTMYYGMLCSLKSLKLNIFKVKIKKL